MLDVRVGRAIAGRRVYPPPLQCDYWPNMSITRAITNKWFSNPFTLSAAPASTLLLHAADKQGVNTRVSQKNTFFEFRFAGRITGANGCPEATKKISAL